MEKKLKIVIGLTVKLSDKTTPSHPNSTLYRNSWIRFPALVTASTDLGGNRGWLMQLDYCHAQQLHLQLLVWPWTSPCILGT